MSYYSETLVSFYAAISATTQYGVLLNSSRGAQAIAVYSNVWCGVRANWKNVYKVLWYNYQGLIKEERAGMQ